MGRDAILVARRRRRLADNPNGDTLGTFNPLFPSGFYELLAGYPGYANFMHLKSSAMVRPTRELSALFTGGSLWRRTTADAVYLLPAIPVFGTAGRGSAYSGAYAQIRVDWVMPLKVRLPSPTIRLCCV